MLLITLSSLLSHNWISLLKIVNNAKLGFCKRKITPSMCWHKAVSIVERDYFYVIARSCVDDKEKHIDDKNKVNSKSTKEIFCLLKMGSERTNESSPVVWYFLAKKAFWHVCQKMQGLIFFLFTYRSCCISVTLNRIKESLKNFSWL